MLRSTSYENSLKTHTHTQKTQATVTLISATEGQKTSPGYSNISAFGFSLAKRSLDWQRQETKAKKKKSGDPSKTTNSLNS